MTGGRLAELEAELERKICGRGSDHPVRNALAIARGLLELGEPIDVRRVEEILVRAAECIGDQKFVNAFLVRLRTAAAWTKFTPPFFVEPKPPQPPAPPCEKKTIISPRRDRGRLMRFQGRLVSKNWFTRYGAAAGAGK